MLCPICGSDSKPEFEMYDDRYGYPGVFALGKCDSCGHVFVDHKFTDDELVDLYSNYYPRSNLKISDFREPPEKCGFLHWLDGDKRSAFRWVPKNVRVLDIGCGFGETLAYHSSRGCEVYGVEADRNIQKIADKFGFNVHVGLFDEKLYKSEFFDYVTMDQVIEHVADPIKTLIGIRRILKKDGFLLLAVPNPEGWGAKVFGNKWINWHVPYHLHHYSESSMSNLAEAAGFRINKVAVVTSSNWLNFQWKHLLTFPAEGEKSDFWSGARMENLSNWKKLAWLCLSAIHAFKVNHLLTRLFDSFKVGDSQLFFLTKIDD